MGLYLHGVEESRCLAMVHIHVNFADCVKHMLNSIIVLRTVYVRSNYVSVCGQEWHEEQDRL
jgi:hypothetical protein